MMKRVIVIVAASIVLIFVVLIVQAALKPRPFNWIQTYSSYDKQPYGASIIFNQLKEIFPGQKIKRFGRNDFSEYYWYIDEEPIAIELPAEVKSQTEFGTDSIVWHTEEGELILDTLDMGLNQENTIAEIVEEAVELEEYTQEDTFLLFDLEFDSTYFSGFNVVMISDQFYCDRLNAKALLLHAYQGNDVFIAANDFNENLMRLLGIETILDSIDVDDGNENKKEFLISIHNNTPVQLRSYSSYTHITAYPDSAGIIATNNVGDILGVKVKVGPGSVTLFSLPLVFTNYYLLKEDNSVAERLLLNLPNRDTHWGNLIMGNRKYEDKGSLLSFIHSRESLTWAFYTIVISSLLFLLLQTKRKQRIIPILQKPENDSLRFIEIISNLYLLNKNNKDLLRKKMTYFLEMIRSRYHMNTSIIDEPFFAELANKSKVNIKIIKKVFRDFRILDQQQHLRNPEFLHFNKLLQHFKERK